MPAQAGIHDSRPDVSSTTRRADFAGMTGADAHVDLAGGWDMPQQSPR
jgi:hypothetical protein